MSTLFRMITLLAACLFVTAAHAQSPLVITSGTNTATANQTYSTINVSGSSTTLTINGYTWTATSTLTISGGAKVTITGGATFNAEGNVTVTGAGSELTINGSTITATNNIEYKVKDGAKFSVLNSTAMPATNKFYNLYLDDLGTECIIDHSTCKAFELFIREGAKADIKNTSTITSHFIYVGNGNASANKSIYAQLNCDNQVLLQGFSGTADNLLLFANRAFVTIGNSSTIHANQIDIRDEAKLTTNNSTFLISGTDPTKGLIQLGLGSPSPVAGGGILDAKNTVFDGTNWKGISVPGHNGFNNSNNNLHKPQSTIYNAKAYFNNCVIKNSLEGVTNFSKYLYTSVPDVNGDITGGGVIQAINTTFSNNIVDLQFGRYQNKDASGYPIPDLSYFHKCTFSVADGYLFSMAPERFIRAINVDGIKFFGCTYFDGLSSYDLKYPAVDIIKSGLIIDGGCYCPTNSCYSTTNGITCGGGTIIPSSFTNLKTAISIMDVSGTNSMIVRNSTFKNISEAAISVQSSHAVQINNNTIQLTSVNNNPSKGIAIGGSELFRVENNEITGDNSNYTFGIVADDNQGMPNEIYKNSISTSNGTPNIAYAIQANGWNYNQGSPNQGLRFFCNNLSPNAKGNAKDIEVRSLGALPFGIAGVQGDLANQNFYAAKNQFASKTAPTGDKHISISNSANSTTYVWGAAYTSEHPLYTSGVTIPNTAATLNHSCTNGSYYDGTTPYWLAYTTARDNLHTLINTANPTEMDEYGFSAYDGYLTDYAKLTNRMIYRYLYPEATFTTDEEGNVSLTDTVIVYTDSLMMVLEGTRYIYEYKLWLAGIYAQRGQYTEAYGVLDNILEAYTLTDMEEGVIEDFRGLLQLSETLAGNDDWSAISSSTKTWVADLAANGIGYPRYMSRYFLARYENNYMTPEAVLDEESEEKTSEAAQPFTQPFLQEQSSASIYPNPVGNSMRISLKSYTGKLEAELYDITGRKLRSSRLDGNGINYINTEALLPGSYIVKIMQDGKPIKTQHITKQ